MNERVSTDTVANPKLEEARQLHGTGRLKEAEAAYNALLETDAALDAQHGLALIYNQTGRSQQAIPMLEALLAEDPGAVSSRLVLARCLAATGQLIAAIEQAEQAAGALPANPAVWNLLGQLRQQAGDPQGALEALERALKLDPTHGPALHNQGITLAILGQTDAALLAYEGALRVMPSAARVFYNYALALEVAGREDEAIQALQRTLDLRPGFTDARLRLVYLRLVNCEWRDFDSQVRTLEQSLEKLAEQEHIGHLSLHILNLLALPRHLHRRLAQRLARGIARQAQASGSAPAAISRAGSDQRVRVAYLSPDLGAHAVGGLVHELFAAHDAERFRVGVFSLRHFEDEIGDSIRKSAPEFEDLSRLDFARAAKRLAAFAPDILIDLGGYTDAARPELTALRLAPVQISWLGYLNTMGAPFIDYLIADETVVPPGSESDFDEQVLRLERCFLPSSRLPGAPGKQDRAAHGLPEEAFVFASFNNTCKVQPAEFRAWAKILRDAPDAVLWLYDGGREAVRRNLRAAFEIAGLDPARLIFAPRVSMQAHMARMPLADLFLDTFDYNAGATAIAAAQADLPLLTQPGDALLGRMGASINRALGLEELVCADRDAYITRAIELAADPDRVREMSGRIGAARVSSSGLFDLAGLVRELESLLEQVHARRSPVS